MRWIPANQPPTGVPADMMKPIIVAWRNGDGDIEVSHGYYFNEIDFEEEIDYDYEEDWPITGFYEYYDYCEEPLWREIPNVIAWQPLPAYEEALK